MPAVANIVLNDAQATPVAHTFIPMGPDANGVWWWEDQSGASPIGNNRISAMLKRPPPANTTPGQNSATRVNKVKAKLYLPKLENVTNSTVSGVSPAPTISYVLSTNLEVVMPERCSLQDRKDLRKFTEQLVANAIFVSMVESVQNVF